MALVARGQASFCWVPMARKLHPCSTIDSGDVLYIAKEVAVAFERFSRNAARTDTGAKWLSVQGNGSISLSYSALKDIGLPEHVHLLYDSKSNRIAVQAANAESKDAYPTRPQGRGVNEKAARVVSASAFFKHIGLDAVAAARRYDVQIEEDMIIAAMPSNALLRDR